MFASHVHHMRAIRPAARSKPRPVVPPALVHTFKRTRVPLVPSLQGSILSSVTTHEFDGKIYVQLSEVTHILDAHTISADQSAQQIKLIKQLQEELERTTQALASSQQREQEARADADRAVSLATQQLEEKFDKAYADAHKHENDMLKQQLQYAVQLAQAAEEKAKASATQAEEMLLKHAQDAVSVVEAETQSIVQLARVSATAAKRAAEQSAAATRQAVEQQQQSVNLVRGIQSRAAQADKRAATVQQEAAALQQEITKLRQNLQQAHNDLAAATQRAVDAEKAMVEKARHLDHELGARSHALEQAYEALKRQERERTQQVVSECQNLQRRNEELMTEIRTLREQMAASQNAVAQATSQMEAMQKSMAVFQTQLESEYRNKLDTELANLETLKQQSLSHAKEEALSEVNRAVERANEAMTRMQSGISTQMEALQRALEASGAEKAFWRQKCVKVEEELQILQLELKVLNEHQAAIGNGDGVGPGGDSSFVNLRRDRLWEILAVGPRAGAPGPGSN